MQTATSLKNDLPNFPDELLATWILPFANSAGWPPAPNSRWDTLFAGKPLAFWRDVEWSKYRVPIAEDALVPDCWNQLGLLILKNVHGHDLFDANIINSKERFDSALKYIGEHGDVPAPPPLLRVGTQYRVLDGNHRLAAFLHSSGLGSSATCWVAEPPAV